MGDFTEPYKPVFEDSRPVRNTFGVASLILGIISVCFMGIFLISIPCGGLSVVFSVLQLRKKPEKKSYAIAGLIIGIAGILLALLVLITYATGVVVSYDDVVDLLNSF